MLVSLRHKNIGKDSNKEIEFWYFFLITYSFVCSPVAHIEENVEPIRCFKIYKLSTLKQENKENMKKKSQLLVDDCHI